MSAAVDSLLDLKLIEKHARGLRPYGVEFEDLVSETAMVWLKRARAHPDKARQFPGRMARFAAQEALRRLTGSRRAGRLETVDLGGWELAAAPPEIDDEDIETSAQRAEWRSLPASDRLRRIAESERALGTSPSPNLGVARGNMGRTRAWYAERGIDPRAPRVCCECGGPIGRHSYVGVRTCSYQCGSRLSRRRGKAVGRILGPDSGSGVA